MWAKLWAAIEAIKVVASIVNKVIAMYEAYQDKKIDKHYEAKQKRRSRLMAKIVEEKNKEIKDEQALKDLHRKLRNIGSK